jgi:hypothetical protein
LGGVPINPADFGKLIADENREMGQGDPGRPANPAGIVSASPRRALVLFDDLVNAWQSAGRAFSSAPRATPHTNATTAILPMDSRTRPACFGQQVSVHFGQVTEPASRAGYANALRLAQAANQNRIWGPSAVLSPLMLANSRYLGVSGLSGRDRRGQNRVPPSCIRQRATPWP